ncbi:MAG: rhomboid family intramembrane serine protease [Myxococcales bacterium]|nr:rhomboid family intramembrane serine protease [Myxococcales bacterium]
MFILPIAHQENTGRRWPVIAIFLVATNVLIHVGLAVFAQSIEARANAALSEAIVYAEGRPYLSAPCLDVVEGPRLPDKPPASLDEGEVRAEQAHMNALCREVDDAIARMPVFRFGDVPKRGGALTLFTHQFLHGGWLHLLFNMWFLWLTACNLEDRWGRPVFLPFYLAAGVAGAFAHRWFNADSATPMIGASGAIAGAMGGFLVIFAATPIKFFYVLWLGLRPTWGTFEARAVVMLPLWLLVELVSAVFTRGSGTAHWAHVGGFVFGAAVAGLMRVSGLDEKLDRSIAHAAATHQDARILRAGEAIDAGRTADAIASLRAVLAEQPNNVDAQLELLRAARTAQDGPLIARVTIDLAGAYLEAGDVSNAADLLLDLRRQGLEPVLPRDRYLRLGERMAQKGHVALAAQVFNWLHTGTAQDEAAARAALGHAMLLTKGGQPDSARELLARVRQWPLGSELASRLDAQLARLNRSQG